MGVIRPDQAFNGSRNSRTIARATLQSLDDLGFNVIGQNFKDWVRDTAPLMYREGARNGQIWVEAMGGQTGPPFGKGHKFLNWRFEKQDIEALRATMTQRYQFANEISEETRQYVRSTFMEAVTDRRRRRDLMGKLISDGELTSLVDKAGRTISVQRRAQMFADWHQTDTFNTAQFENDRKAFGDDPYKIWDAVIDLHTSEITLQRAGKIAKESEWGAAGGNVFDGSGYPPLWPGCRCKLRAVDPTWFEDGDWEAAQRGEPMLVGRDREIASRRLQEFAVAA